MLPARWHTSWCAAERGGGERGQPRRYADVPPRAAAGHLHTVLDALDGLQPAGGTDLHAAAEHLAERVRRGQLVMVFSDLFDDRDEALARILALRARRNDLAIFHVLDPAELEFPFDDPQALSRWRTTDIEVNAREIRESYLEEFKAFLERTRATCAEADVDYALVRTDEPLDAVLLRFLGGGSGGRRDLRPALAAPGRAGRAHPARGAPLRPAEAAATPLRRDCLRAPQPAAHGLAPEAEAHPALHAADHHPAGDPAGAGPAGAPSPGSGGVQGGRTGSDGGGGGPRAGHALDGGPEPLREGAERGPERRRHARSRRTRSRCSPVARR